jgi:hypothetical protein
MLCYFATLRSGGCSKRLYETGIAPAVWLGRHNFAKCGSPYKPTFRFFVKRKWGGNRFAQRLPCIITVSASMNEWFYALNYAFRIESSTIECNKAPNWKGTRSGHYLKGTLWPILPTSIPTNLSIGKFREIQLLNSLS